MKAYLKQRTLEALGSTDNNDLAEAARLLAEWAMADSRLLQLLTEPYLRVAAAKSIEQVAVDALQKKSINVPTKKPTPENSIKTVTYRHKRGSATPSPLVGSDDPIIETIIGNLKFKESNLNEHRGALHDIAKAHLEKRLSL